MYLVPVTSLPTPPDLSLLTSTPSVALLTYILPSQSIAKAFDLYALSFSPFPMMNAYFPAESSILYNTEKETKYLLTNPIEFSYTNDYNDKMIVNVREIVSSTSQPIMYTNANLL